MSEVIASMAWGARNLISTQIHTIGPDVALVEVVRAPPLERVAAALRAAPLAAEAVLGDVARLEEVVQREGEVARDAVAEDRLGRGRLARTKCRALALLC